ncbi:MAG TPA: PA2779 family protein [Burkholderiales bacterium]|jgi:hypothetical protein|nr:PA2779 family protein [Burkholderiales bacterium]
MKILNRLLAGLLATSIAFTSFAQELTLITTEQVAAEDLQKDRALVMETLQRPDVQEKLRELGVSIEDAQARVAALTDQEVSALSQHVETAPAGGTDALGVVLVVFIVLLITDIMGFTSVFPFVKHGSGKAR